MPACAPPGLSHAGCAARQVDTRHVWRGGVGALPHAASARDSPTWAMPSASGLGSGWRPRLRMCRSFLPVPRLAASMAAHTACFGSPVGQRRDAHLAVRAACEPLARSRCSCPYSCLLSASLPGAGAPRATLTGAAPCQHAHRGACRVPSTARVAGPRLARSPLTPASLFCTRPQAAATLEEKAWKKREEEAKASGMSTTETKWCVRRPLQREYCPQKANHLCETTLPCFAGRQRADTPHGTACCSVHFPVTLGAVAGSGRWSGAA